MRLEMIENTEDFGIYVDELRIKGVPVDDYSERELVEWYNKWQDVQEMDNNYAEIVMQKPMVSEYVSFSAPSIGYLPKEKMNLDKMNWQLYQSQGIVESQIKDDVTNLMKHYRLLKQKIERMEEKLDKLEQIEIRRLIR